LITSIPLYGNGLTFSIICLFECARLVFFQGCRASLNPILQFHFGKDLMDIPQFKALFKHFHKVHPQLLVEIFRSPPYVDWKALSLKQLTLKMFFLLALASGRRRGELANLSFDHGCALWTDDRVVLKTSIGFVAKRDIPGRDPNPIIIP